jgi:hypothetical protein
MCTEQKNVTERETEDPESLHVAVRPVTDSFIMRDIASTIRITYNTQTANPP